MRKETTKALGAAMLAACIFAAQPLQAQENQQASPEQMMVYMKMMMKGMLEIYSSPDMAETMASFYKNLYEALIRQGFTKEQALQIVVSQGSVLTSSNP